VTVDRNDTLVPGKTVKRLVVFERDILKAPRGEVGEGRSISTMMIRFRLVFHGGPVVYGPH
jgi:hypothetical protein